MELFCYMVTQAKPEILMILPVRQFRDLQTKGPWNQSLGLGLTAVVLVDWAVVPDSGCTFIFVFRVEV